MTRTTSDAHVFFALLFFIFISNSNTALSQPIPVDDIFRSPDTYSYKLSSTSEYIAKHYFRGKEYDVIELIDAKSDKRADAFRMKIKKYAYIKEFYWIDSNTLYISYRIGKNKNKRIFLDIDYNIFQASDEEIGTIRNIKSNVEIIDPLILHEDTVLVQRKIDGIFEVLTVNTGNLVNDKFKNVQHFEKLLDKSLGYITGTEGNILFASTIEGKQLQYWYLKNYQSEWVKLFKIGVLDYYFQPVEFLGNGRMAVISDKDTDKKSLVEFNYETKKFGNILYQHDKYDLVSATISEDKKSVKSVAYYDHGRLERLYFGQKYIELDNLIKNRFPGKQYFVHSQQANSQLMILFVYSSTDPGSYHLFDQETKEFRDFGSAYSVLNKYQMSTTENYSIQTENNIEIEAILTRPTVSNGVLLVEPHGGPIGIRNIDNFNPSNQFYASRGYTILNVNYRGSRGFGKKFLNEGRAQFGKQIEQDITVAVRQIKEKYDFDHTCSVGASYGGYSAMMLAAYHPKDYDCIVGAYGVYDLPLLFNASSVELLEENEKALSTVVGKYNDSLVDYSPVYFAEKITQPVLLIAGAKDSIARIEHSNRMKYRLKQLDKYLEVLFYDNTGHGHETYKWDRHEHLIIEDFIRRILKLDDKIGSQESLLASEMMILGDSYEFSDIVPNNEEKAFRYYSMAASLNEPRGLYNLGSFYQDGRVVKKNLEEAIKYYKKSSMLNYSDASFRLAGIYINKDSKNSNFEKSYEYYQKAKEQGNVKAEKEIIQAKCMGRGVREDIPSCLKYLRGEKNFNLSIITEMLLDDKLERRKLESFIELLEERGYHRFSDGDLFSVENDGLYRYKKRTDKYSHHKSGDQFRIKIDFQMGSGGIKYIGTNSRKSEIIKAIASQFNPKIGLTFTIQNEEEVKDNVLLIVSWERPYSKEDPSSKTTINNLRSFKLNTKQNILSGENWGERNGEWKLKIHNLEHKLLYLKTFNLTFDRD